MRRLWLITDEASTQGRGIVVVLARALSKPPLPSMTVVLRAKHLNDHSYTQLAMAVAHICHRAAVPLLLHNHPRLVAAVGAAGCHLSHLSGGAGAAQRRLARLQMPPRSWLSMSVHDGDDTPTDVDGVLWGPVHAPLSKPLWGALASGPLPSLPTWVVGGMTPSNWSSSSLSSTAAGVATIGSVMGAAQPDQALHAWASVLAQPNMA